MEQFELVNFKSNYPERLVAILENLKKIQTIKKKKFELEKLDKNIEQVQEIIDKGLRNHETIELLAELEEFKTWRNLYLEFKNTKFDFSIDLLMNEEVQPLFPFEKLGYLLDNHKKFEIEQKTVDQINLKIANFKKISEDLPMNTVAEKITKIKKLFENGIQIESLEQPLLNLKNQIIFIKRAYNCIDYFNIEYGKHPEIDKMAYTYEGDKGKSGKAIVEELLSLVAFRDTPEYKTIELISIQIEKLTLEAEKAILDRDESEIDQILSFLEDKPIGEHICARLRLKKKHLSLIRNVDEILNRVTEPDPEVTFHITKIANELSQVTLEETSKKLYYENVGESIRFLYQKIESLQDFPLDDEIRKQYITDSKSIMKKSDENIQERIQKLKEIIQNFEDSEIWQSYLDPNLDLNENSEFLKIPLYLIQICSTIHFGIKSTSIEDKAQRLMAIARLENPGCKFTLETLQRTIQIYKKDLEIWTPNLKKLTQLHSWASKVIPMSRKVLAKVSRYQVQ